MVVWEQLLEMYDIFSNSINQQMFAFNTRAVLFYRFRIQSFINLIVIRYIFEIRDTVILGFNDFIFTNVIDLRVVWYRFSL